MGYKSYANERIVLVVAEVVLGKEMPLLEILQQVKKENQENALRA